MWGFYTFAPSYRPNLFEINLVVFIRYWVCVCVCVRIFLSLIELPTKN